MVPQTYGSGGSRPAVVSGHRTGSAPDDTGGDGLNDQFESSRVKLDPLNPDSDGDGNVDGCDPDPEAAGPKVGCTAQG